MILAMELQRQKKAGFIEGFAEGFDKGFTEGFAQGRIEVKQSIAIEMLRDGFSGEKITKYTHLSIEDVMELGRKHHLV